MSETEITTTIRYQSIQFNTYCQDIPLQDDKEVHQLGENQTDIHNVKLFE